MHSARAREVNASGGFTRAPTVRSQRLGTRDGAVTAAAIKQTQPGHGLTDPTRPEDSFMVVVARGTFRTRALWADGRQVTIGHSEPGLLSVFDLSRSWVAELSDPFSTMQFHVPRREIDGVVAEEGLGPVGGLMSPPGGKVQDPISFHLVQAIERAMDLAGEPNTLFLDHMGKALVAHLARTYGGMAEVSHPTGGLAPWQLRRVTDLLSANLSGDILIGDLARECGLSAGHFARAFRQSTGLPPHRWLMQQRVERALDLLLDVRWSLAEIASATGFVDQSHFTRVFASAVGTTPGAWRRARIM